MPLIAALKENPGLRETYLTHPQQATEPKKTDKVKITALVALILAALIIAAAGVCLAGLFPVEIFGGQGGTIGVLAAGLVLGIPSAITFYLRWKKKD